MCVCVCVPVRLCLCPVLPLPHQKTKRTMEMLFVRGDTVILVSPPLRTG